MKITTSTIIRSICLFLALTNQILYMSGIHPLPIDDDAVALLITNGATIATALIAWWKNNSFTKKAILADKTFK